MGEREATTLLNDCLNNIPVAMTQARYRGTAASIQHPCVVAGDDIDPLAGSGGGVAGGQRSVKYGRAWLVRIDHDVDGE